MAVRELTLLLKARDELSASLNQAEGKLGGLGNAAGIAFAAVGAGAIAAGAALLKIGGDFDEAFDAIRIGTGKTGEVLEGLKGDFKAVLQDVPTDMKTASAAIADLNTRLGLTGEPLQTMSKQFLELSRITGTDVKQNVALMTRVFGDWGVVAEEQSGVMDLMFRATQETGIGLGDLQAKVVQFGAPLRAMGFSLNESVAMLGKWEKEGVNTELVLGSLRIAMGNFAEAGVPMRKGLMDTVAQIQKLGPSAEATSLAMKTFGARAGPDMAAAILEGRFAYQDLLKVLEDGTDTIMGVGKDTMDAAEKFNILKNRAMVLIEPLASGLFGALSGLADVLLGLGPHIEGFSKGLQETLAPVISFGRYIAEIIGYGDYMNDFLADIPEPMREIAKAIGQALEIGRDFIVFLNQLLGGGASARDVLAEMPEPLRNVANALSAIVNEVGPVFLNFIANLREWFTSLEPLIGPAVENVVRLLMWLQEQIGAFIETVGEWWTRHGEDVIRIFKGLWEVVQGIFEVAFSIIGGIIKIFLALIGGDFDAAGRALEEMWRGVWGGIEKIFSGALEVISALLWTYVTTFGEIFQRIGEAMWDALSLGLDRLVDLARDWLDRFLQPFRDAWDQVKGLFGWMIGGSVVPDMLEAGLDRMLSMAQDFGSDFAGVMGDAAQMAADAFGAGMGGLGWPSTPKLSDEAMADIMVAKLGIKKEDHPEWTNLQRVQDWATWKTPTGASVLEGFGSWQEFAAGKGWLPKAPAGPRISPSSRAMMGLFEQVRPFARTDEEAVTAAVEQMRAEIVKVSGGKITPSAEDMQKWWNNLMGQVIQDRLNAAFGGGIGATSPALSAPVSAPKPSVPASAPITITIQGLFLSPDRSIAEQLARILKPELDALTRLAV